MLSMVSGCSSAFAPNPFDGYIFLLEPARPLAATIVDNAEGLLVVPFGQTLYASAAVLLVSTAMLSLGGWYARRASAAHGDLVSATRQRRRRHHRPPPADAPPAQVEAWPRALVERRRQDRCGPRLVRRPAALRDRGLDRHLHAGAGIQYVSFDLLTKHPQPSLDQSKSGGFLDLIIGTFVLDDPRHPDRGSTRCCDRGLAQRRGKPAWLARAVESGIEIVAGILSIVLAIFGLLVFSNAAFGFLSFTAEGGAVFVVFFTAGAERWGCWPCPRRRRDARGASRRSRSTYARPPTRSAKTGPRRSAACCSPAARPGIATGTSLGMGRIAGDTAIVVIARRLVAVEEENSFRSSATSRTGSTLTSYVYNNSPAGEGNAPEKAYAACLRAARDRDPPQLRRRLDLQTQEGLMAELTPPPVRRIALDADPTVIPPREAINGNGHASAVRCPEAPRPGTVRSSSACASRSSASPTAPSSPSTASPSR